MKQKAILPLLLLLFASMLVGCQGFSPVPQQNSVVMDFEANTKSIAIQYTGTTICRSQR